MGLGKTFVDFNPHHRKGGDPVMPLGQQKYRYFNPHHRKGGDLGAVINGVPADDFNPHHRKGGDSYTMLDCISSFEISIHTTAKVVTLKLLAT